MRSRKPALSAASRGRSLASCAAMRTYSSGVLAAISVNPRLESWLNPARLTGVVPTNVTTGTPIQYESRLVV